jgi:serine/threonine protein kinase
MCTSEAYKEKVSLKLLDLAIELNKVSKKLFSLKPCHMLVNYSNGEVEIILRREFGNSMDEDESSLLYRAPEVLLGFTESEASYVWSIGLLIDQVYHERPFYRKLNEILSHKSTSILI